MKKSNFKNLNSLLHADWHPDKGDFIKENSLRDSAKFKERIRNHNILAISLTFLIVVVFISAIILVSL